MIHINKLHFIILVYCCLLLTACMKSSTVVSHANGAPEWISGEPDMYPDFKYLSATGSASKPETAKDRALSNLAKIFEVQIREVSTTRENVESHREKEQETVSSSQSLSSTINLHTDKMVQGARIAEQWQSPADLTWYALAVLDRTQAGNNIRHEMNRIDEQTDYLLKQAENRTDPLQRIGDLNAALQQQRDRRLLQKSLKVIDVKGRGSPSSWNIAELEERLGHAMRQLPVQTLVTRDTAGGLAGLLQGAVSQAGFVPGNSGYGITASMQTQDTLYKQGWYWLRGNLKLSLLATDGVTVLGYKSWPLKVSAQSEEQLASRMQTAIENKLDKMLLPAILSFAKK